MIDLLELAGNKGIFEGSFSELGMFWGVPRRRIIVLGGLYWGPRIWETTILCREYIP